MPRPWTPRVKERGCAESQPQQGSPSSERWPIRARSPWQRCCGWSATQPLPSCRPGALTGHFSPSYRSRPVQPCTGESNRQRLGRSAAVLKASRSKIRQPVSGGPSGRVLPGNIAAAGLRHSRAPEGKKFFLTPVARTLRHFGCDSRPRCGTMPRTGRAVETVYQFRQQARARTSSRTT